MSDGMSADRRTSRGGRHVAPESARTVDPALAPRRTATAVAKAAVVLGLVLGVSGFATAAPSALLQGPLTADVVGAAERAQATADAAALELLEHRETVLAAASAASAQALTVRADAAAVAVPSDTIAPLDEATAELDRLLAALAPDPAATADPTSTPSTEPAAEATPTAGAAEPTVAAEPSATATATASPSADEANRSTDASTETPSTGTPALDAGDLPWDDSTPPAVAAAEGLDASDQVAASDSPFVAAAVEDPETTALRVAAVKVADLTAQVAQATAAAAEAVQLAAAAAEAEAARAAAEAATRAAQRTSLDSYANGRVPASALCSPTFATDAELRCDAAAALELLDVAFVAEFGTHLQISDSYRSYAAQVTCRRLKGSLCASPGTSNHGLGLALDLEGGAQTFGTRAHNWLLANAEQFGWTLPEWARVTGSKPEAWHWEYIG